MPSMFSSDSEAFVSESCVCVCGSYVCVGVCACVCMLIFEDARTQNTIFTLFSTFACDMPAFIHLSEIIYIPGNTIHICTNLTTHI